MWKETTEKAPRMVPENFLFLRTEIFEDRLNRSRENKSEALSNE